MSSPRLPEASVQPQSAPIPGESQLQPTQPAVTQKRSRVAQQQLKQNPAENPLKSIMDEAYDTDDISVNGEISPKRSKGTTLEDDRRIRKMKEGAPRPADRPNQDHSSSGPAQAATTEADRAEAATTTIEAPVRKSAVEAQRDFLTTTAPMPKSAKSAPLLMGPAKKLELIFHGDPTWNRSKQADAHLRAQQAALV